jgi:hypothetical protein
VGKIDWWRCWSCGRKVPEAEVVWLLTGPAGYDIDGRPTRPQPYHADCAEVVPLERTHHPSPCDAMPVLQDGKTVCGKCRAEYTDEFYGAMFHP